MNVFSLHKISAEQPITLPFALKEYKRYEFGDDRLAYRFGTELAKAFVAHALGTIIGIQGPPPSPPTTDLAVAVLSDYIPPSTNGLRNHFVAYLNRHLVSTHARPVRKIDVRRDRRGSSGATAQAAGLPGTEYHVDRGYATGKTVVILDDIRLTDEREAQITRLFQDAGLTTRLCFVYLAEVSDPKSASTVASTLSSATPPIKDVESIAQGTGFSMNEAFVKYVLGRDHAEFCQFLRRQDDSFARLLLDYALGEYYHTDDAYQQNVKFLLWEVGARENMLGGL